MKQKCFPNYFLKVEKEKEENSKAVKAVTVEKRSCGETGRQRGRLVREKDTETGK